MLAREKFGQDPLKGIAVVTAYDPLPNDPAALRIFAAALLDRCNKLKRLLVLVKSVQFGKSSDKVAPDQLHSARRAA